MNKTILPIALIACAAGSGSLHAQNLLTNGGLEGPGGTTIVPNGWEQVPYTFSEATTSVGATADTLTTSDVDPPFGGYGMLGTPHSGDSFVSGIHYDEPRKNPKYQEGIQQQVHLNANELYTLSFFQSVIKQSSMLEDTASWIVYLDDQVIFRPDDSFSGEAFDSLNTPWEQRTHTFTALNDGPQMLRFLPQDSDGSPDARMGIDTIDLRQVPEPSSLSLLGLGSIALLARRKR